MKVEPTKKIGFTTPPKKVELNAEQKMCLFLSILSRFSLEKTYSLLYIMGRRLEMLR